MVLSNVKGLKGTYGLQLSLENFGAQKDFGKMCIHCISIVDRIPIECKTVEESQLKLHVTFERHIIYLIYYVFRMKAAVK